MFVQSVLLLERLMIDTKKSLNFGYKLATRVSISRLLLDSTRLYLDRHCLEVNTN